MSAIAMITKKINYDSGVVVSMRHLEAVLKKHGIEVARYQYESDQELVDIALNCPERFLNIHVPAFSDETLDQIVRTGKKVMLSIHSTLCNLQTEGGMLERVFCLGKKYENEMVISCPSRREVTAMNAFGSGRFVHLPNTFSYPVPTAEEAEENAKRRLLAEPKKIGFFCAYRPLKNLPVQIAAACLCRDNYALELHFQNGNENHPLFRAVRQLVQIAGIPACFHEQQPNRDFYESLDDISLLMQVSLSETLSYVALEHMVRGIPVIGSTSIPFATVCADYSDVEDIAAALNDLLMPERMLQVSRESRKKALEFVSDQNELAVCAVRKFMDGVGRI